MLLIRALLCLALLLPVGGHAAELAIAHADQQVTLAMPSLLTRDKQASLQRWIQVNALALAQVYGRWPHERWVAEVTPIALFTDDPVPFARVMRGEPDRVEFYISLTANEERLVNDWTAYHEFSHLLIPYRGWGDMWFSEGLASYYQNILRRRIGILDEQAMWQKLYEGFKRGQDNNADLDMPLAQLSSEMRQTRAFRRVYWSGAYYFLAMDVALRQRTDNAMGLDEALGLLAQCCALQTLSASAIAQALDEVTGQSLFVPAFEETRNSRSFPQYRALFQALGLELADDTVALAAQAPLRKLRDAIGRQTYTGPLPAAD